MGMWKTNNDGSVAAVCLLIGLTIGAFLGHLLGRNEGINDTRRQALKANVAEKFYDKENDTLVFRFLTNKGAINE